VKILEYALLAGARVNLFATLGEEAERSQAHTYALYLLLYFCVHTPLGGLQAAHSRPFGPFVRRDRPRSHGVSSGAGPRGVGQFGGLRRRRLLCTRPLWAVLAGKNRIHSLVGMQRLRMWKAED